MVGKLKHAWPDKDGGGGVSNGSSTSASTPGKLKNASPFSKASSTSTPGKPSSASAPGKLKSASPFSKPATVSTSAPAPGKLQNTSPFAKASVTPSKVGKLNPSATSPSKWSANKALSSGRTGGARNAPSKLKGVKVKVTEGSFKPKAQNDTGVKESFVSGELIVDGGEISLKEVGENLQKDNFLEKLVLKNCKVDDAFVGTLAKNLREIIHVDLSKNGLSEDSQMQLITAALQSNKVVTLKLGSNSKISKANCDKIAQMLPNNHCISELDADFAEKPAKLDSVIDRNCKVNGYCERIKKANSTLDMITRRLSVRDNELVTQMIKAEENDPSVKEIKIVDDPRFGHIQNTIIVGFAEGLRTNLNLKILIMKGLDLGNIFLSGLAASIESNFTLEIVDISRNAFTSDGMSEFCQAMALNESITQADLRQQHSPIFSYSEEIVIDALEKNHFVREFQVEFKTPECNEKLQKILERNKKESKTIDYDQKLIQFLSSEADTVEELAEQRKLEAKPLEIPEDDWEYFYELEELAKQFQHRLAKETGTETDSEDEAEPTKRQSMRKDLNSRRTTKRSVSDVSGLDKKVNLAAIQFTNDGSFLTNDFITQYIVDNPDDKSVTFDFGSQFKMFKRFPIESPHRQLIVSMFADALVNHPRANEITHINMCNSFLGNDWLVYLCEICAEDPKLLPKLHSLNLETNFISEPGVIALSKCIASKSSWKYLQAVKLENQKFLLSSKAENELAKALYVNRSVITVNLRVRNIHERTRIEKYVYRNTDLLRQARRRHKIKTGTLKERKRNKMEQFIDNIAADDASIIEVELIGDQLFLALNKAEKLKAAKAFATNKHITKVKMCLLKLDDEFGILMGKSMEVNNTIESLVLESNNFAGEGIKALVGCLAKNKTLTELQLRHQGKVMPSSDETLLAGSMGDNDTVLKLGLDLRHMQAKNDIDRRIRQNQDKARKNRKKAPPARSLSSEGMIKSVATQNILERVIRGDKEITSVVLNNDQEFIKMETCRKNEFFEGMKKNKVVTSLTMNDVQLDNSFAEVLVSILQTNTTLTSISLDKNWFTSLGVYTIVDAIIKKRQIKKLSILKPRAKISNEEAERLLRALENGTTLQELNIEFRDAQHTERIKKALAK